MTVYTRPVMSAAAAEAAYGPLDGAALVHDFFVQDGGAERCALELAHLLPRAAVYTSFFDERAFGDRIDPARVRRWPLDALMGGRRFRSLLPLYPLYFSTLDLRRARLVVSSSVAFSKAIRTSPRAIHISYVHTPMRYAWALDGYLDASSYPPLARTAARVLRRPLAAWDRNTAVRPDLLIANSQTVRDRIHRFWGRQAQVIHPPVDTSEFEVSGADDGYLLVAARLLAYRRLDHAVLAATLLGRDLVVVGNGPERARLEHLAGRSVRFMGHVPRAHLVDLFQRCHAYVLPGEEDFGIAPVEAMASGKPVIALARGGATETVVDGVTGVLYDTDSAGALAEAIQRADAITWDRQALRRHAQRFDRHVWVAAWRQLFETLGVDPELYAGEASTADDDAAGGVG